jgi:hypothetical protein
MLYELLGDTLTVDRERDIQAAIKRRRLLDSGGPVKARPPVAAASEPARRRGGRLPAAL